MSEYRSQRLRQLRALDTSQDNVNNAPINNSPKINSLSRTRSGTPKNNLGGEQERLTSDNDTLFSESDEDEDNETNTGTVKDRSAIKRRREQVR